MNALISAMLPLVIFAFGYILKRRRLFSPEDGARLLRLVFFTATPFLVLRALHNIEIDASFTLFPVACVALSVTSFLIARGLKTKLNLPEKSFAVFLIGSMLTNSGIALPFIITGFGDEGVARFSMFLIANVILPFTWIYGIAVHAGGTHHKLDVLKKIASSPALWAITLALIMNGMNIRIPLVLESLVDAMANLTAPLIMLALGMMFCLKPYRLKLSLLALILNAGLGLLVGLGFVFGFNLQGVDAAVILILAAAPIGYNTVTFSTLEDLDTPLAMSLVSIGIAYGLIALPILSLCLGYIL